MKQFSHYAVVLMAVSGFAGTFSSLLAPMAAKSLPIMVSQKINFKPPEPGKPDYRERGNCTRCNPCPNLLILLLMPPSNQGLTVSQSPTFFAYVSKVDTPVEFRLETADSAVIVYETTFKVDKPGIVEVRMPNSGQYLKIGKLYQWSLLVVCDPSDRSGDYYVKGLVQRVEPGPALKSDLANSDLMARAIAFANNEIWYDTVSTLARMRRNAPDDKMLAAEWQQLLKSQKLDRIATQPLVDPH